MTTSRRTVVGVATAVGVVAVVAVAVAGGTVGAVVDALAMVGVLVATWWGTRHQPPGLRPVWLAVFTYVALTLAGDLAYLVIDRRSGRIGYPALADALYVAAYGAAFVVLGMLIARLQRGRDREAWIDTFIIGIAALMVTGILVIAPIVVAARDAGIETTLSVGFPVLDVVILCGLLRVLVGLRRVPLPVVVLSAGFAMTFVADLVYSWLAIADGGEGLSTGLDSVFLLSFVLIAIATWLPWPDADTAVDANPADGARVRMAALSVGALLVPVVLTFGSFAGDLGRPMFVLGALGSVAIVILVVWRLNLLFDVVRSQSDRIAELARTDALTGLANRRTLDFELARLEEAGTPMVVAMLDLDHFKAFNDAEGHQAGDRLLSSSAAAWQSALPSGAFLARYGGEEFLAILPGWDAMEAATILEHVRRATPAPLTVSIGYAERSPGESAHAAVGRSDEALYVAKQEGRNRVVGCQPASASEDSAASR